MALAVRRGSEEAGLRARGALGLRLRMPPPEDAAARFQRIARRHGWHIDFDDALKIAQEAQEAIEELGTAAAALAVVLAEARRPLSFGELHEMYSAVRGWEVDKKTVEKLLSRLVRAGLVAHEPNGPYTWALPDLSNEQVLRRVANALRSPQAKGGLIGNYQRVAVSDGGFKPATIARGQMLQPRRRQGTVLDRLREEYRLPVSVERALDRIERLESNGRRDVAIAYLAHTLLPLRKSARLLYFSGDGAIVYFEHKTNKLHVLSSKLAAELLDRLGLRPGRVDWSKLSEAEREAARYIRQDFGGYQQARHVHFHLKKFIQEVVAKRDPELAGEALSFPLENQAVFAYVAPSAILLLPASAAPMLYGQRPLNLQQLLSQMPQWLREHLVLCPTPPCDVVQALTKAIEEARRGLGQPLQVAPREHEDFKNEGRYFS